MVARIWHTVARCNRCDEPVTLLELRWHHAGPSDHAVEVLDDPVIELELEGAGADTSRRERLPMHAPRG
jgi:hypothetical protein